MQTYRSRILSLALVVCTSLVASGADATPNLIVSPNPVSFGTTTVGSPLDRFVFLNNIGSSDLFISGVSVAGNFSVLGQPNPFFAIRPGSSTFITVRLNAFSAGTFSGSLTVFSNDPFSPDFVSLLGKVEDNGGGPPDPLFFFLEPNADALIKQEDPSSNFGTSPVLRIRHPDSTYGRHSFLRFTVPANSRTVQSAVLRIRTGSASVPQASFYDVDITWNETTINWNNWLNGGTTFSLLRGVGPLAPNTWHDIDVKEAIPFGGGVVNIGIATTSSLGGLSFYSRESAFKPELRIVLNN